MDHSNMAMTSAMSGMPTGTAMSAMPSSTGMAHDMGGMSMGKCKISMTWNWNVIDACFISNSWRITSKGMFAGSCIGVILLVILLEFLRRAGKEYDRFIVTQHAKALAPTDGTVSSASSANGTSKTPVTRSAAACASLPVSKFRPNIVQQATRALLHMLQFAVAYFIMLLAMYYNGYIIFCIFIGAYLGYFIFGWESFNVGQAGKDRLEENVTVCCG